MIKDNFEFTSLEMAPFFFFLFLIDKECILKRGTKRPTQGIRINTPTPKQLKQKGNCKSRGTMTTPPSNQSMKLTSIEGPSFTSILVCNQRKQIKEPFFSLWIESMSSPKAIIFFTFQTIQKMHKGTALQTFLHFLPTNEPC